MWGRAERVIHSSMTLSASLLWLVKVSTSRIREEKDGAREGFSVVIIVFLITCARLVRIDTRRFGNCLA
jgi:hypothetical protein